MAPHQRFQARRWTTRVETYQALGVSMKHLIFSFLAFQLAGCSSTGYFKTYEGPQQPDSEHARVYASVKEGVAANFWAGIYVQTRISCVDGANTKTFTGYGGGGGYAPAVLLTPGLHYLTVIFSGGQWQGGSTMWLDAEAGHVYDTKYEQRGRLFRMWLEDRGTGKPVGGLPGGEPAGSTVENKCK